MKTDPRLFFYASIIFLSVGGILGAWNDVWRFALGVLLHIRPMKAQTEQRICRVSQIFGDILFCLLAGISVVVLLFYFSDGKNTRLCVCRYGEWLLAVPLHTGAPFWEGFDMAVKADGACDKPHGVLYGLPIVSAFDLGMSRFIGADHGVPK